MTTVISKLFIFFSLTHKQIHKFRFQLIDIFFIASSLFLDFLPNQTHIARSLSDSKKRKVPQLILYMDCYFSQEHLKIV